MGSSPPPSVDVALDDGLTLVACSEDGAQRHGGQFIQRRGTLQAVAFSLLLGKGRELLY